MVQVSPRVSGNGGGMFRFLFRAKSRRWFAFLLVVFSIAQVCNPYYMSMFKSSDSVTKSNRVAKESKEIMRTMLFITTHMSEQHSWFLETCWPAALRNSLLLNTTDVFVYLNPEHNRRQDALDILQETFKDQNIKIHVARDTGDRQSGAMAALTEATRRGWFQGYDWVIRVNPDVIIRNDTFLLNAMENDPDATGLLINCRGKNKRPKIHTDFFAIKPEVLPPNAFLNATGRDAEDSFTNDIYDAILKRGKHRLIPGAHSPDTACRAGRKRDMVTTPIVHFHPDLDVLLGAECPIPF